VALFVHTVIGMRRHRITVLLVVGLGCTAGCSSSSPSTFSDGADSAPPADDPDSAIFSNDAGSDAPHDVTTTCALTSGAGFTPTWKAPVSNKTACAAPQITGYADACLTQPLDAAKCTAWKQANGSCAGCIESDDTAAEYGPVIWHDARQYYTLNVAGCIAIEQKDLAGAGCAGAYQASVSCNEASCENCFSIDVPSFDKFVACEKQAATGGCKTYAATESTKCATIHDADASTTACFAAGTENAAQIFARVAPLFCGP